MPILSSGGIPPSSPDKSVTVLFNPVTKSFSYTGDINPVTEEIKVQGACTANIRFVLEGATWATPPIKWVTEQKAAAPTPHCMTVNVVDSKKLTIVDNCEMASAGSYRFLVCVNSGGTVVCSDPRLTNEPHAP